MGKGGDEGRSIPPGGLRGEGSPSGGYATYIQHAISALDQSADPLDTWKPEDLVAVRSVGELRGQVLAGEVKLLMVPGPPLRAIGDVIDNAGAGNVYAGAALTGLASKLGFGETPLGIGWHQLTG